MIQIDIDMPTECSKCFACEVGSVCRCVLLGHEIGDNIYVFHNRADDCPLKEVSVKEHFKGK